MRQILESIGVALARRSWTVHTHTDFTARTTVAGVEFNIPVGQGRGLAMLSFSRREEGLAALVREVLARRPGAVVDVGANLGRFLLLARAADPTRWYVGFDVHVVCAAYLQRLILANRLGRTHVFPLGLSDRAGVLTLRTNEDDDVSASTIPGHYPDGQFAGSVTICVERGDTILGSIPEVDPVALIKVDVEGAELEVLAGLSDTMKRHAPALIIEVAPYQQHADAGHPDVASFRRGRIARLEALLHAHGYHFARIRDDGSTEPVATLDPGQSRDVNEMDYLCLRASAG